MGRCVKTLTNHKKAIRSLVFHPEEYTFASGAADNIKVLYLIRFGNVLRDSLWEIYPVIVQLLIAWLSTDKMS